MPEIQKYTPDSYKTYYEGFLGGGAVFLDLNPETAELSDINSELITAYRTIRDNVEEVITELAKHEALHSPEHFMTIRAMDRDASKFHDISNEAQTARMIYLNRTCFNGLYRVNSKGQFNVPFGKYANPKILDTDNLRNLHKTLQAGDYVFSDEGYAKSITKAGTEDFVYLDPPYVPLTDTSSFVSYTKSGFDINDQIELRDMAKSVDNKGGYVLLSNSDTPQVRKLYADFVVKPIEVKRSIGATASTRKNVGEVLILGKTLANEKNLS